MHRHQFYIGVSALLCTVGWAQTTGLRPGPLEGTIDYLYPSQAQLMQVAAATQQTPTPIDQAQPVVYHSFWDGAAYNLTEFRGKYVSLLLPASWVNGFTLDERRTLLDRTDLLYSHYLDLIGREPAGSGLLRIAMVSNIGGAWGRGWIGLKGVEIIDEAWALDDMKHALSLGDVPLVIGHEMCHNFDVYSAYLGYVPDAAHAWTVFLDAYMQVYLRQGYLTAGPTQTLMERLLTTWAPYLENTSATWQNSIRQGNPNSNFAPLTWGGLHWRFAQLHGAEAVRRAMRFWQNFAATKPPPSTSEAKEDLDIEGLAAGAGLNLSCYVDAWRWYASPAARARMLAAYGSANPNCRNGRVIGDPSAVGTDPVTEPYPPENQVPFPAHIAGAVTAGENDNFWFWLSGDQTVGFTISTSAGFSGILGVPWNVSVQVSQNSIASVTQSHGPGEKSFYVRGNPEIVGSAAYTVDIYPSEVWQPQPQWGSVTSAQKIGDKYRFTVSDIDVPSYTLSPTAIRFWVSGFGFVGTIPFQGIASFDWAPPGPYVEGVYSYRAELFAGDVPVTLDTKAMYFWLTNQKLACGRDAGDQVTLTMSGFRMNHATRHMLQTVSVTPVNTPQPMTAPYALTLQGLSQNVTLANAAGLYSCNGEPPSPFVFLDPGAGGWPAGQTVTVVLEFIDPQYQEILYSPKVAQQVEYQ